MVQQNFLARQKLNAKNSEASTAFAQGMVYIPCIYQQYALGWCGYALGKVLQIGGMFGAGKSSRMMYLARCFYEAGGLVYPVDIEHAMHRGLISAYMGEWTDMFDYAVVQPDNMEAGFAEVGEILKKRMKADDPDNIVPKLLIFDTLGAVTKEETEVGDVRKVGGSSGEVTSFINSVIPMLSDTSCLFCLGNQIRDKIDIGSGPAASNQPWYKKVKMPGGHALEHSTYYLEYWKQAQVHKDKNDSVRAIGHSSDVVMIKNKADSPYRFYGTNIYYDDRGMDFHEPGIAWLYSTEKAGVDRKKSSTYVYWSDMLGIPESSALPAKDFYTLVNSKEFAPQLHRIFGIKFPKERVFLPASHEGMPFTVWEPAPESIRPQEPECPCPAEEVPEPTEGQDSGGPVLPESLPSPEPGPGGVPGPVRGKTRQPVRPAPNG